MNWLWDNFVSVVYISLSIGNFMWRFKKQNRPSAIDDCWILFFSFLYWVILIPFFSSQLAQFKKRKKTFSNNTTQSKMKINTNEQSCNGALRVEEMCLVEQKIRLVGSQEHNLWTISNNCRYKASWKLKKMPKNEQLWDYKTTGCILIWLFSTDHQTNRKNAVIFVKDTQF